jgi:hypothetical protein
MSKAVFHILLYCLLASNAFITNAFAQSIPSEETPENRSDDADADKAANEDIPSSKSEKESVPSDDSVDAKAASDESLEGEPTVVTNPETAETRETPADGIDPTPLAPQSKTQNPQPVRYQVVRLVPISTSPRPSSGTGLIVAGSIIFGIGVLNLAFTPLCYVLFDDESYTVSRNVVSRDICVLSSLAFGGVMVAVGVPLLIVGFNKRSNYNKWRRKNRILAGFDLRIDDHKVIAGWKTAL